MNLIKQHFYKLYTWFSNNAQKIIFVVGLHFIFSFLVNLPYVNIFAGLFSFLPYFFDLVLILILFRPNKESLLKLGLLLFSVSCFFNLIRIDFFTEILGQVIFFMIATYVILSLREIRN